MEEGGGGVVVGGEGIAAALGMCDVACFLYDTSDPQSFNSAAQLYVSPMHVHVLIVFSPGCFGISLYLRWQPIHLCKFEWVRSHAYGFVVINPRHACARG